MLSAELHENDLYAVVPVDGRGSGDTVASAEFLKD